MQSWRVKSNNTYLSYLLLGLQPSDFGLHTSFRRREIKLGLQTSDFSPRLVNPAGININGKVK